MFPTPSFRPSDYAGGVELALEVSLSKSRLTSKVLSPLPLEVSIPCDLQPAKNPEKTEGGVKKAFSKLGGTDYRLGKLTLNDPEKLFAPMSVLNDLRRDLVERLDEARDKARREKVEKACGEELQNANLRANESPRICQRLKIRSGQTMPSGEWDEIIIAINSKTADETIEQSNSPNNQTFRLALPVYTAEPDFNRLRTTVKRFLRAGYDKWEASDLATLRMLRELGVSDITADWTLYAFNSRALRELSAMGVKRFVASPENNRENLQYLAESGYDVEFLTQQSTPLFVSLTEPAARPTDLAVFRRDGLWVTTKPVPRTFETPEGGSTRLDLSWDPE